MPSECTNKKLIIGNSFFIFNFYLYRSFDSFNSGKWHCLHKYFKMKVVIFVLFLVFLVARAHVIPQNGVTTPRTLSTNGSDSSQDLLEVKATQDFDSENDGNLTQLDLDSLTRHSNFVSGYVAMGIFGVLTVCGCFFACFVFFCPPKESNYETSSREDEHRFYYRPYNQPQD